MGLGTSRNFPPSRTVDRTQGPPVDRTQGPRNQRIEPQQNYLTDPRLRTEGKETGLLNQ